MSVIYFEEVVNKKELVGTSYYRKMKLSFPATTVQEEPSKSRKSVDLSDLFS